MVSFAGHDIRFYGLPEKAEIMIDSIEVDLANSHIESRLESDNDYAAPGRNWACNVKIELKRRSVTETNPGKVPLEILRQVGGADHEVAIAVGCDLTSKIFEHKGVRNNGMAGPELNERVREMETVAAERHFVL
jgi:hypothetical protein